MNKSSNPYYNRQSPVEFPLTRSGREKLSLTRRGKIATFVGGIVLAVSGCSVVAMTVDKIEGSMNHVYTYSPETHRVVAVEGEGLMGIALEVKNTTGGGDLRDIVQHLIETNPGLANGLGVGESVVVPDSVEVK